MQRDSIYSSPAVSVMRGRWSRLSGICSHIAQILTHAQSAKRIGCCVAFIFICRGAYCMPKHIFGDFFFHLCFWSVNEASRGCYGEPLKSYWHVILSSTTLLRLFSYRFPTLLSDRKSLLLCAVCLPARCPPLGFDTGGRARRFPRVLRTDIPFIFPPGRLR